MGGGEESIPGHKNDKYKRSDARTLSAYSWQPEKMGF